MNYTAHLIDETFNGTRKLARALRVSPSTVQSWKKKGKIPASRLLEIENLTGVSREKLRPDLYTYPTAKEAEKK
ncbi:helix-turn-helix domain-containing protein [Acetobacteraceae bacterium]|nr:helix-turn-helix domain-containing protein [Acetobacteraceae bacterium]